MSLIGECGKLSQTTALVFLTEGRVVSGKMQKKKREVVRTHLWGSAV